MNHYTVSCLRQLNKKKLEQLIKANVYTLSNKQLAQYLVRQDKGFIISNENIHLNDSEDWVRILHILKEQYAPSLNMIIRKKI